MLRWPQEATCFRSLLQQTLSRRVGLPLLTTLTFSTAVTGAVGAAQDVATTHKWSMYSKKGFWSMMGGDGETPAKSGPSGSGTPTTPEKKTNKEENRWPLRFSAGAAMLPHPDKVHKGGEDSYFIAENEESSGISGVGVADGVGGWADLGVDAGEYSRLLMANAKKEVLSSNPGEVAPIDVIIKAHRETLTQGSSTACVVVFEKDTLHAANLGDSGFVVVRDEDVAFKSPAQQHGFNFPYQLGCDVGSDPPQVSDVHNVKLQQGDMIVLGTDGLFDNIFDEEVAALATVARKKGLDPTGVAGVLASAAQNRGADRFCVSPFSVGAREAGFFYQGGKLDDVTVVVVFVEQAQSKL